jgi:putative aldouronate transport system permease protein
MKRTSRISKTTFSDKIFDIFVYCFVFFVGLIVAYPLYFIVIASLSDQRLVASGQVYLFPKGLTLAGYQAVFKDTRIWTGYRNTLLYTFVGTAISMAVTIPAAYALSRKNFLLRNFFMTFFVITMFFRGGLIPTYINLSNFHLIDTIWVVLVPFCLSVYNMIIARTFFQNGIPPELHDAALIDGCTTNQFFFRIVLPLSRSMLSVIALYYLVGKWNEYFNPMVFLNNQSMMPLQVVLREILIRNMAFEGGLDGGDAAQQLADLIKYTVIIISALPLLVIYPYIQKYFEKGVMIGALKG